MSDCAERVEDLPFAFLPMLDESIRRKALQIDPFGIGDVASEGGENRVAKLPVKIERQGMELRTHGGQPSPGSPARREAPARQGWRRL